MQHESPDAIHDINISEHRHGKLQRGLSAVVHECIAMEIEKRLPNQPPTLNRQDPHNNNVASVRMAYFENKADAASSNSSAGLLMWSGDRNNKASTRASNSSMLCDPLQDINRYL